MSHFSKNLILITRPKDQAKELIDSIEARGGKTILFPTLTIIPPPNQNTLKTTISQLSHCDIAIFISANAVKYATTYFPKPYPAVTNIAIGPATKKMLTTQGIKPVLLPDKFNTEGLLQMPNLQNITNKKIMIFAGQNSKATLADSLRANGAILFQPICYQRQCPQYQTDIINSVLANESINIIISTSLESLKNLIFLLGKTGMTWLQQRQVLVISQRMLQYAQDNNLNNVLLADNATNAAIITALEKNEHDGSIKRFT